MAINNKPASAYVTRGVNTATAKAVVTKSGSSVDAIKMSVGSQVFKSQNDEVKSSGIKQRGAGAATKGFTSRGPMA